MRKRTRRGSRLDRLFRPGLAVSLLGLGLLLAVAFVGIAIQRNGVAQSIASLSGEIAQEQLRHVALEAAVAEKGTSAYVQDKARELGYVLPGEGLLTLDNPQRQLVTPVPEPTRPDRLRRWAQLFFGTR